MPAEYLKKAPPRHERVDPGTREPVLRMLEELT